MPIVTIGEQVYIADSLIYNIEYQDINLMKNARKRLNSRRKWFQKNYAIEGKRDLMKEAIKKYQSNDKKRILGYWKYIKQLTKQRHSKRNRIQKKRNPYQYYVYGSKYGKRHYYTIE